MTTVASDIRLPVLPSSVASPSEAKRSQIARDLAALIEGDVRFDRHYRMLYATDASLYQVEPIGVVCPRNIAEAEKVLEYCAAHELPVLPRGGGTSLAGQTVNTAVVIDFSAYCRNLLEVNASQRFARVEPGIVLDHLNAQLAPYGLQFGPDVATSSHANIGGMIGNNSAGAYSIMYGRTVEHLLALDVMLADGTKLRLDEGASERDGRVRDLTQRIANVVLPREREIEKRFPKIIRHVDGYNLDLILQQLRDSTPGTFDRVNLAKLICGSEGTLAVTLEATLNLVPQPKRRGLAIVGFADVEQALHSLIAILDTKPAAVELIDDVVIDLALKNTEYQRYVELLPKPPTGTAGAVLYVAYFADDDLQLQQRFDELQSRFAQQRINCYTDPAAMLQAWKLRKAGEPLLHGLHGPRKPLTFVEDLAVDPHRLADFVRDFRELVKRYGTRAAYYAHASVGCLHIRPLVNIRDERDRIMMQRIAEESADLVMRYGGALSGEHGDGRVRSHLLERYYGKEVCDAFRAIKAIFDPHNRLNPGNIVSPTPDEMLENLRVKPGDQFVEVPPVKTYFRYEKEHGFAEAVELCNGAGVCRRMKNGTMCPSYRATLDERHATRGRGNALRLAITGQFSTDGRTPAWNDPDTLETLSLCLSCKACKSECPSNVDIAKLKAEYLAQSYAASGRIPLTARVFGHIRLLNRLGSAMYPIANAVGKFAPMKMIVDRLLGLHPKRALPHFDRSLYRWMASRTQPNQSAPAVVLFPDCFTVYNEPHIGRAAVLTLEALGYRVVLPKLGCCGRSLISTGLLAQAISTCRRTAQQLLECVKQEQAVAVVGCEPSCVSAIKDEWLDLDMGIDPDALHELAAITAMVEQFIEAAWERHPRAAEIDTRHFARTDSDQPPVLLHAHCHQKALWGEESSSQALARVLGQRLRVLDSGCCGMAGSFGYMNDHYDVSIRIGEQSLFGPVRETPEAIVLAPGTSCRQQLHDALGRKAQHPIELIAQELGVLDAP